jgi:hypothetical protein
MNIPAIFGPRFFRIAALCSFASAITTLGLIFLPRLYSPARTFEDNIALATNSIYTLRLWNYLVHPLLVMTAALGVAVAKLPSRAAMAVPGFLGFFIWGCTELLQQSLSLVANHYAWRAGYNAADEATKTMIRTQMFGFDAVWDALYVVLLIGFILGNTLYGFALWKQSRFQSLLAALFFAAAALSVFLLLGQFQLPAVPDRILGPVYPLLQPAARALIGVFLWRVARDLTAAPALS